MGLFGPPDVEKLKAKGDVPKLIQALGYEKDPGVRERAAGALGSLAEGPAVESLIAALGDAMWQVRKAAAEALGLIGDQRAVEPLMSTIQDQWSEVRGAAAEALGLIGDQRAVEPLISALGGSYSDEREAAATALVKIGAPAIEPLVDALKRRTATGQTAVAAVLDRLEWSPDNDKTGAIYWAAKRQWDRCVDIGAPAVEPLVAALEDSDMGAATALGRIGAPAVVPLVSVLLNGRNAARRKAAAVALGAIGDPRAVEALSAVLSEAGADPDLRRGAVISLGQIGDSGAVKPLLALLSQYPVDPLKDEALAALAQVGDAAVESLVAEMVRGREWAFTALGLLGTDRALDALLAGLSDSRWTWRKLAAKALIASASRPTASQRLRVRVLASASVIREPHNDSHADLREEIAPCGVFLMWGDHTDSPHEDRGIGERMPSFLDQVGSRPVSPDTDLPKRLA